MKKFHDLKCYKCGGDTTGTKRISNAICNERFNINNGSSRHMIKKQMEIKKRLEK